MKEKKIAGIYVVAGPLGVYVGESSDCYRRNRRHTILGIPWGIVREMPESKRIERVRAEREVADHWGGRGFRVVSVNTTDAVRAVMQAAASRPDVRDKHSARRRGRPLSLEHRASIRAAMARPEVKIKHAAAMKAVWSRPGFLVKVSSERRQRAMARRPTPTLWDAA